ncbi:low specificity L-threonine aldolase, partial [Coprococcus sp. MSK.21.13]|nr:threonine aldolase family protein [Bacteroidales bacterium MSK.15.36]NSJ93009.1 low specificity L-threonine aldolase [Coprococcus sp. MSK.21.13]
MDFLDLRSDTVTKPTENMRKAMFEAVVGDDVYGDDPTVNELEEYAAKLVGKEAALFVPSGVFGNQLSLFTHCKRGDEVILGEDCHIIMHETG